MHCTGTTLELLPTEVPAHTATPGEPKLPEPAVSNPALVREVMGWGFSKEEATAKASEIQSRKGEEEEIKECDVKVSESKVKEEVARSTGNFATHLSQTTGRKNEGGWQEAVAEGREKGEVEELRSRESIPVMTVAKNRHLKMKR